MCALYVSLLIANFICTKFLLTYEIIVRQAVLHYYLFLAVGCPAAFAPIPRGCHRVHTTGGRGSRPSNQFRTSKEGTRHPYHSGRGSGSAASGRSRRQGVERQAAVDGAEF